MSEVEFSCITPHFGEDWCACSQSETVCTCEPFVNEDGNPACKKCGVEFTVEEYK